MSSHQQRHTALVAWQRDGAPFLDNRYSRGHQWTFDGGTTIPASASPHIVPPPMSVEAAVDPEEAFVASLSSCHMLWFLSLAAQRGHVVDRYEDAAEGILGHDDEGHQAIVRVTLRPAVRFAGDAPPTPEQLDALHHAAHDRCFLARSVRCPVIVEPQPAVAD